MPIVQPTLSTPRLLLLPAQPALARAMLDFHVRNRQHFEPWDPKPGDMFFTELYWTMQLRQRVRDWEEGRGGRFLLALHAEPERVIGSVGLSNISRGAFQSCHLGYGLDQHCQGQGLMREALEAVIRCAFDTLRLHRIQANYQPHNLRSAGLLKRLGFEIEGHAKNYLYLNGGWRDHVLTSRLNPDFDPEHMLA
ncbi:MULTISPECIES: GNAT family N-acetyltransferase [Chromobacterium]|uniref:Alanine acetyltransferase n=1 Tax=Chromobacterium haemolyticum TaxID=394935 RepID=A0A1W0CRD5_9NEIS|nr:MULTISPECIES: GNAT family N-acetyltransferase [Chromobacterium]OQS37340.1 alanine acetyltransferase [Chromobacterium haemolyticum]QOZ81962.1 GNAT family N-acetyltransferase [Chromobacterium sp. Rain0013]WON81963.1 GNAT family N-acetyltransferase [Chromobacterium haemolyticum]